ncbi:hypothetical protein HAX54_018540, partial [Datura stramonium]|nr:hypothetical protein [Datura stramonium]
IGEILEIHPSGTQSWVLKAYLDEEVYIVLDALTRSIYNNTASGFFKDKTFNGISIILGKIEKQNHAWYGGKQSAGIN